MTTMTAASGGLSTPRLRRLARRTAPVAADQERCELCSAPITDSHRHMLDVEARTLRCACLACAILFDHSAAGGDRFRLVPTRRVRLHGFTADDLLWAGLGIPVDMAFCFRSTPLAQVVALFPSPVGMTESSVEPGAWQQVEAADPALAQMEPDVEALLVNRARGAREHWLVPVDDCYRLAAVVRTRWVGFNGGEEVWDEIARFFAQLQERR
jgi:hypothetical protein